MFKSNQGVNPQALMAAQSELDKIQSAFDQRVFSAESGGVVVNLSGKKNIVSVKAADGTDTVNVNVQSLQSAYDEALSIMEHERNLLLVQLRNSIQKRFRADIKGLVPEIAAAVAYMDNRKVAS